jgi:hypothetical protein
MSAPASRSSSESRDAVLFYFQDTDLGTAPSQPGDDDDFVRHYVSMYFANDLQPGPRRTDLDRLLALAREREQFCRGAGDLIGLARCLGNQALIQKARDQVEEALALLQQLEPLCRRLDDVEGVAFTLAHRADLLAGPLNQPAAARPLAEQANALATEHHLSQLVDFLAPLLASLRA